MLVDPAGGGEAENVLFFLAQRARSDDALLSVQYYGDSDDGEWFSIPKIVPSKPAMRHYSTTVLSLVSQLVRLNQSRSELPTTGVVTAIGN